MPMNPCPCCKITMSAPYPARQSLRFKPRALKPLLTEFAQQLLTKLRDTDWRKCRDFATTWDINMRQLCRHKHFLRRTD